MSALSVHHSAALSGSEAIAHTQKQNKKKQKKKKKKKKKRKKQRHRVNKAQEQTRQVSTESKARSADGPLSCLTGLLIRY